MLDEALICTSLLHSTVYSHDNISFEMVLLWQILLKLANNFNSYGEEYWETYREKGRQMLFSFP